MADLARGQRIKALREERGYRQQDIADALNIELRSYQRQEERGGIKPENAKKLAEFYGVDYLWLMHGEAPDLLGNLNGSDTTAKLAALQEAVDRNYRILRALAARLGIDPKDLDVDELVELVPGATAKPAQRSPRRAAAKTS